mgnify:CR=1 FL=1
MNVPKSKGFTDKAAQVDRFNISEYFQGLATFIEACNTPMTISIQGSWGTGKTSIMNFVEKELTKEGKTITTIPIEFNTWQFSQFNMQDQLVVSLLSNMMHQMKVKDRTKKGMINVMGAIKLAGNILYQGTRAGVEKYAGGVGVEILDKVVETVSKDKEYYDTATAIADLKSVFEQCIMDTIEATPGADRVVFFIDDLDRLEPKKAVELLEVMKLFFDVPQCVFILAIDYDVVVKGVSDKYGKFSDSEAENAAKGRSFFDKIIQVPFKMPVAKYNITEYVGSCFDEIGIRHTLDELKVYEELIRLSIGINPRIMKRLFNAFLLLTIIVKSDILETDKNKQVLFATLCMQHSYEGMYNLILQKREDLTGTMIKTLCTESLSDIESKFEVKIDTAGVSEDRLKSFMSRFFEMIDKSGNGVLEEKELYDLKNVLGVSSITNSVSVESDNGSKQRKKYEFEYIDSAGNRVVYASGNRRGVNLGNLAHDIIRDAALTLHWNKKDAFKFRDGFYMKGKTGWLNEVILIEDEVIELPSDPSLVEEEVLDDNGRSITPCIEAFAHGYLSYLKQYDKKGKIPPYDHISAENDKDTISLSDGTLLFVARFWGASDIVKLLEILKGDFLYEPNLKEI